MRSCEISRKLVGSWKLESGVNKGDVREIKKGRLRKEKKKKKTIVKHERGIVIILTLNLSISINYSFNLYFLF
jgi:hypothetical protein